MNLPRLIFLLFGFFSLGTAFSQASVKATVDKDSIMIGEPIVLTIELSLPSGTKTSPLFIDSIAHFEFLKKPVADTMPAGDGQIITTRYTLTSFDSGHWVIPAYSLADKLQTDTIPVDVVFSPFDPSQDYHDVKDIVEVQVKEKKQWWYAIAASVVLLGLIIWLLIRKKKPAGTVKIEAPVNAYQDAMKELAKLQQERPAAKEYYSRLTDVFRLYISRKKGLLSLQETTDDLVVQLKILEMDKEQFNQLSQALKLADFVKFAKYTPSAEDDRVTFDSIKDSIGKIEQKG